MTQFVAIAAPTSSSSVLQESGCRLEGVAIGRSLQASMETTSLFSGTIRTWTRSLMPRDVIEDTHDLLEMLKARFSGGSAAAAGICIADKHTTTKNA